MDFKTFLEHFDTIAEAPNGIPKLRSLILDLAVRGKLVPQSSEDEPAQDLLSRIAAVRKELVQKGVRGLPTTTSSTDDLNELPCGWQWVKVGNLTQKLGAGSTPKGGKQVYVNLGIKFIRSQNVWDDGLWLEGIAYISPEIHQKMNNTIVQPGDVLLNITGASIGRSALIPLNFDEANVSQHVAIVRPILREMNQWIHLYLISPMTFKNIMDVQVGISREGLSMTRLKDFFIPLPPLAEQKQIVEKVDELMSLCDRLQAAKQTRDTLRQKLRGSAIDSLMNAQTDEELQKGWAIVRDNWVELSQSPEDVGDLRRSVLQLAVQGKLVLQNPEDEAASTLLSKIQAEKVRLIKDGKIKTSKSVPPTGLVDMPFALPSNWEWAHLEMLVEVITKGSSPKWQGVNYVTPNSGGVLFITSENVRNFILDVSEPKYVETKFNEIEPRSILQKKDFLMNIVGASIGRTAMYELDEVANINQAVCLIRLINTLPLLDYAYMLLFFNSAVCVNFMFDKQVDNARANLSMGNIAKFPIPLPPLAEQKRIVAKVDELMQMCDRLEESLRQSQQWAEALAASAINHLTI